MSKEHPQMIARMSASNITMADLAEWWQETEKTHGVNLRVEWRMSGSDELAHWLFTVNAYKGVWTDGSVPFDQKSLVWPTASHKTVLGALLWLLVGVDDALSASE